MRLIPESYSLSMVTTGTASGSVTHRFRKPRDSECDLKRERSEFLTELTHTKARLM